MTLEQTSAFKEKEKAIAALSIVQQFFVEQLSAANPEAANARKYASSRWDSDFCKEFGVGYAPRDVRLFMDYVHKKALSTEFLFSLGYLCMDEKTGRYYPSFRDRLMIPIRDLWGKVIGFTGRYFGTNPDVPKYKNSSNSVIYQKGRSVFGIDDAHREARCLDCFVAVEGAPDVMRLNSIGINNAVAPLGTGWTEGQFAELKRFAPNICFIPDSDPVKENEMIRRKSELGDFWRLFSSLYMNGRVSLNAHFRLMKETKFTPCGKGTEIDFEFPRTLLYINYDSVEQILCSRMSFGITATKIDFQTLQSFLELSPQFLGKKQLRFVALGADGLPVTADEEKDGQRTRRTLGTRVRALCFDYEKLKADFDINLESLTFVDDTDASDAEAI